MAGGFGGVAALDARDGPGGGIADTFIAHHLAADAQVVRVVAHGPRALVGEKRRGGDDNPGVSGGDVLGEPGAANRLEVGTGNRCHVIADASLEEDAQCVQSSVGHALLVGSFAELLIGNGLAVGEAELALPLVIKRRIELGGVMGDIIEAHGLGVFNALVLRATEIKGGAGQGWIADPFASDLDMGEAFGDDDMFDCSQAAIIGTCIKGDGGTDEIDSLNRIADEVARLRSLEPR